MLNVECFPIPHDHLPSRQTRRIAPDPRRRGCERCRLRSAHSAVVVRQTAERIIVELKDKIGIAGAWEASSARRSLSPEEQRLNDAVLALLALGFKQVEAHDAVRGAQAVLGAQATVEDLVRACLKKGA